MDHTEFDLLVDRHLDGGLDLDGQDRLEGVLRSDAKLRHRFWELARIHGQIAWVTQERHADLPANDAISTERALRDSNRDTPAYAAKHSNSVIKTEPTFWRRLIPAAVAAGIAITVGFAWMFNATPTTVAGTSDAVITALADVRWQEDVGPAIGEAVGNRPLRFTAGLVQVRFANGATVIVDGPAVFTAINERSARLEQGRIVARVPESAKGFTVESGITRVVDLGTEFGFAAQSSDQQDVHVFDGLVQVFATKSPDNLPQALHRGEAARVDASGTMATIPFEDHSFVRAMPAEKSSSTLLKGLVAWWKLDERSGTVVRDASGNGHDGVIRGATFEQTHVAGKVDGAIQLPRPSFIEVPDHPDFHLSEMTLHAWIKPAAKQGSDAQIISKQGSYGLAVPHNDAMKFYFWQIDRVVDRPFPADRWVNLCATFDGTIRRFYVDGVRIASITSPAPPTTTDPVRIGTLRGAASDAGRFFQGTIDDVRVYNRALTEDEVRFVYLQAVDRR